MNLIIDSIVFLLVVAMAIFVGIAGILRLAGTDPLCEAMVPTQGGRIALNVFYIIVGLAGLYMAYMYGAARVAQLR